MWVVVDDLGEWDAPPPPADRARIDAFIARERERFARETRTYDEPVGWYFGVVDPDVEDAGALAEAVRGARGVRDVRVIRREWRGDRQTWLVLRVLARSRDEAALAAVDVLIALVWPDERIAAELGDGAFFLSLGGSQEVGLVDFEDRALFAR